MTKNTVLENLDCGENNLTSLDVSQNTALKELLCNSNQFNTAALISLFGALPNRYSSSSSGYIILWGNPGIGGTGYDAAKAGLQAKNWDVLD